MMDWDGSGSSWWWMLPMMMFMLVLVGAVIWAVIALARSNWSGQPSTRPTAEDILNERFARGEIDSSEYHERMNTLHATHPVR